MITSRARRTHARLTMPALLAALMLVGACRTGTNYAAATAPRSGGVAPVASPMASPMASGATTAPATLRVVTFNIAFAKHVDRAIALLEAKESLRDADVLLLQEMDAPGTERIAKALGLGWVYYPAVHHRVTGRDFGEAVLSRWPIVADARLVLPHPSRHSGNQRIATAATVVVGRDSVRVYSVHLGTPADVSAGHRREQLAAVVADAAPYARVIIAGDLNAHDVGEVAREAGYAWPTDEGPHTTMLWRWDHVFLKGFVGSDSVATGTMRDNGGASDHRPVWVVARLR